MDEKMQENVHELARRLKELHLAATMEEAITRAKEMLANTKGSGKSLRELAGEMKKSAARVEKESVAVEKDIGHSREELNSDVHNEKKGVDEGFRSAKKSKGDVKTLGEQVKYDVTMHKLEKGDIEEAMREVDELECAADDVQTIVKEAQKVQKKKRK